MAANRRKDANLVVSGTIENNNYADTWCVGPNFVMDHSRDKRVVCLAIIRRFNQMKYVLVRD